MLLKVFENSEFCGYYPIDEVITRFKEARSKAENAASMIDYDEVIMYAIAAFEPESHKLLSVEFMCYRMLYSRYCQLCSKIWENCRVFFVRNHEED